MRFSLSLLALLLVASHAAAQPPINTNGTEYAIAGYDPVAYFTDGAAKPGAKEYALSYEGATWLFASAAHRASFEKKPAAYLPAYRGYCAYAAAQSKLVKVDPAAFTIHKGKLYLNYSLDVRAKWLADIETFIARADRYFSTLAKS